MKTCRKCGTAKDVSEFCRDRAYPDGRRARCKACRREEKRAWKAANPERDREHWRRWRAKQPKGTLDYQRRWYAGQDSEVLLAKRREWKRANPERARELNRLSYHRNVERSRARSVEQAHRRRAMMEGPPIDAELLVGLYASPCAYCGDTGPIEIDHVIPLSRGGTHTVDNLAPACRPCNRSKGAKLLSEWKVAA